MKIHPDTTLKNVDSKALIAAFPKSTRRQRTAMAVPLFVLQYMQQRLYLPVWVLVVPKETPYVTLTAFQIQNEARREEYYRKTGHGVEFRRI